MPTETMRSKRSGDVAVVLQAELDLACQARGLGALLGDRQLLLRERDADDLHAGGLARSSASAAPAAADVEHRLAGLEQQLGGDVALLGRLRLLQGHVGLGEVGAGILQSSSRKSVESSSQRS